MKPVQVASMTKNLGGNKVVGDCHSERSEESKKPTLAQGRHLRFFTSFRMTTSRLRWAGSGFSVSMYVVLLMLTIVFLRGCDAGRGGSGDRVKRVITRVDPPTATPLAAPTVAPTTYVVKPGDTLSGIAALFGVT